MLGAYKVGGTIPHSKVRLFSLACRTLSWEPSFSSRICMHVIFHAKSPEQRVFIPVPSWSQRNLQETSLNTCTITLQPYNLAQVLQASACLLQCQESHKRDFPGKLVIHCLPNLLQWPGSQCYLMCCCTPSSQGWASHTGLSNMSVAYRKFCFLQKKIQHGPCARDENTARYNCNKKSHATHVINYSAGIEGKWSIFLHFPTHTLEHKSHFYKFNSICF